jgi:hypothetical protein
VRCCQSKTGFGLTPHGCLDPVFYTGRSLYAGQVNSPPVVSYVPWGSRTTITDWHFGAVHDAYRLRLRQTQENQVRKRTLSVHLPGVEKPLTQIEGIEETLPDQWPAVMGGDKRLHLIPEAKVIVMIPAGDDRLVLFRADPAKGLAKATADGPVVLSQPPTAAVRGKRFVYPLKVMAKGPCRYGLEDVPNGLSISAAGVISWNVPENQEGRETGILLSVTDGAGHETFHGFWVLHPGEAPAPAKQVRHKEFTPPPAPAPFAVERPAKGPTEIVLEGQFTDFTTGGGGRYLILHQPKRKRLAVFDLSRAKVVGTVPVRADDIHFAAGLDKLVVLYPAERRLERWSLPIIKRERVVLSPPWGGVKNIALGAAARGPLLVHWTEDFGDLDLTHFSFLDLESLRKVPVKWQGVARSGGHFRQTIQVRASTDGQVFGMWATEQQPNGVETMVYGKDAVHVHYQHEDTDHVVPGPDGEMIFTSRGRWSKDLKLLDPKLPFNQSNYVLPAVQGKYSLKVDPVPHGLLQGAKCTASVYKAGGEKPVVQVANLDLSPTGKERRRTPANHDKRLLLFPGAKLLVSIPMSNDRVVLYRLDLKD